MPDIVPVPLKLDLNPHGAFWLSCSLTNFTHLEARWPPKHTARKKIEMVEADLKWSPFLIFLFKINFYWSAEWVPGQGMHRVTLPQKLIFNLFILNTRLIYNVTKIKQRILIYPLSRSSDVNIRENQNIMIQIRKSIMIYYCTDLLTLPVELLPC